MPQVTRIGCWQMCFWQKFEQEQSRACECTWINNKWLTVVWEETQLKHLPEVNFICGKGRIRSATNEVIAAGNRYWLDCVCVCVYVKMSIHTWSGGFCEPDLQSEDVVADHLHLFEALGSF